MARILVIGTGPLLAQGSKIMSGQCLRTWHFCRPLLDAGHQVDLFTIPIPGTTLDGEAATIAATCEGLDHHQFTRNDEATILPHLEKWTAQIPPDAIIGINAWPAFLAARLESTAPLWADLNGWTMAEGISRGAVVGHDNDFPHFWRQEATTILRADQFSTVTDRQLYALQGEMAVLGAFHRHRVVDPVGHCIANAVHPHFAGLERRREFPQWLEIPADAHLCLWSGGFNSWTDVPNFTRALALAMEEETKLHLVCTGGAVHGHDEQTWKDFLRVVESSLPRERVHLLGWCELEKVLELHQCATFGINIDGENLETRFGARNRLTNMMGAGLPVLTTRGTEIAEWIERRALGAVVPARDGERLARAIVEQCHQREANGERAEHARQVALEEFSPKRTMIPVLEWASGELRPCPRADDSSPPKQLARLIQDRCNRPNPFEPESPPQPSVGFCRKVYRKMKRFLT